MQRLWAASWVHLRVRADLRRDAKALVTLHAQGPSPLVARRALREVALALQTVALALLSSPEGAFEPRRARAAPQRTPRKARSIRRPGELESKCATSLGTTTKFASVLLHATHRPAPLLETASGVLGFFGWYDSSCHTEALSSQTCEPPRCLMPSGCGQRRSMPDLVQGASESGSGKTPRASRLPDRKGDCQRHSNPRRSRSIPSRPIRKHDAHPSDAALRRLVNSLPNPGSLLQ